HRPSSHEGDVIFVKLQQMRTGERDRVHIDTRDLSSWQRQDDREVCPLFSSVAEQVCLQHLVPGALLFDGPVGGAEYLVLAGEVLEQGRSYERGTWMRLPEGEYLATAAGQQGATVYLKTGHLAGMAVEA
ncbi:cupin domain-containing protein, partial [Pseudomonas indica]